MQFFSKDIKFSIAVGKARDCRTENDCLSIQNTTCIADPRDGKTRCLCGDYTAPLNGACTSKFKGIKIFAAVLPPQRAIRLPFVTISKQDWRQRINFNSLWDFIIVEYFITILEKKRLTYSIKESTLCYFNSVFLTSSFILLLIIS